MLGHISSKGWYEAFEYTSLPLEIFDLPQNFIHGKKILGVLNRLQHRLQHVSSDRKR